MAVIRLGDLTTFTGDASGSWLVMNDPTNTTTYKVQRETLFYGYTSSWAERALTASYLDSYIPPFPYTGSAGISGSLSVTGPVQIVGNLTVIGTSSIEYVTSSQLNIGTNIITVNTATPSVRFGGLAVFDSGSLGTGLTGSMLWDSQNNTWIYSNPSGSSYDGGMVLMGPRNYSGLGSEVGIATNYVAKGDGSHHMTSSQISDDGTTVSIPGKLSVTGGITGSLLGTSSWAQNVQASGVVGLNLSQISSGSVTASVNVNSASFQITSGSSTFLFVSNSGNVGIGTTTPAYKLDVNGSTRIQGNTVISGSGSQVPLTLTAASSANNTAILNHAGPYNAIQLNTNAASPVEGGVIGWGNSTGTSALQNSFYFLANRLNVATASIRFTGYSGVIENYMTIWASTGNTIIGSSVNDIGYKLNITGSGASGSLNVDNTLHVSGSRIGINKSNPTSQLDISGSLIVSGSTSLSGSLTVSGSTRFFGASTVQVGADTTNTYVFTTDISQTNNIAPGNRMTGGVLVTGTYIDTNTANNSLYNPFLIVNATISSSVAAFSSQDRTFIDFSPRISSPGRDLNNSTYVLGITPSFTHRNCNNVTGLYYNPTFTLTGTLQNHRAIQTVTGDVYFASTSGNVGIGTAPTSTYKLDVSGSTRVQGDTIISGSTNTSGSINIDGNIVSTGNSNTIGSTTTSTTLTLRGSNSVSFTISDVLNSRSFQLYKNAGSGYIIENNSANKISYGYASNYFMSWYCDLKAIAISSTASEPTPDNSSIFDLQSTTKGFLSPRMTAAQRTAISAPARGLQVYDTGSGTEGIWYYDSGSLKAWTRVLNDSGSQTISGSLNATLSVTSSQVLVSGSGVNRLTVMGSGSSSPLLTVIGSQGELFSVNDSLSGSLFSVNDISGLPVLEAFSDNRVLLGSYQAPALYTTVKVNSSAGNNVLYQNIPTASYDGVFVDYTAKSGSNVKVGQISGIWSASAVLFTEFATSSFGDTTGLAFTVIVTGSNMAVTASTSTANWSIKTIIRSV